MSDHTNLELNKIFAAVLLAGIVAMLAGFIAEISTEHEQPAKDAVTIEGKAEAGGGEVAVQTAPEPILAMIAAADVSQGEKLSKACAACHSFGKGEPAKVGPNLWGIIGRKRASMAGFSYSDAMTAKGGTWTYEDLNHFIWSPKKFVPGTKMGFIGLKKPDERAAVIAWLRTLADSAPAEPSASDIAAEAKELGPKDAPKDAAKDAKTTPVAKDVKPTAAAPAAKPAK